MELTCHQERNYLIPDLRLSDESRYCIGKYGGMRKQFLKDHHSGIYSGMVLAEILWKHLEAVGGECNGMLESVISSNRIGEEKMIVVGYKWYSMYDIILVEDASREC